jgi:hypothetical protein
MSSSLATAAPPNGYESERIEALAWEDVARAAASDRLLRAARDGQVLILQSALPSALFNRVIGLGTLARATSSQLERVVQSFRETGIEPVVHLGEGLDRAWLQQALEKRGFALSPRGGLKLVRGQGIVQGARTTFDIANASGREAREAGSLLSQALELPPEAAHVFARTAGRPRWHLLVARDAGKVIAAASLFVADSSGYLLAAATLASHRGRGAQAALIERRVRIALALGCTRLFCEAVEPGQGRPPTAGDNLLRAGFRPFASRANWARPGARF